MRDVPDTVAKAHDVCAGGLAHGLADDRHRIGVVEEVRLRREFVLRRMTLLLRASSFQLDFTNLTETRTKTD